MDKFNTIKLQAEDARLMLAAQVHVGETQSNFQMKQYIHGKNKHGNSVFNLEKTWAKLVLAARAICAVQNPQDVAIIGTSQLAQRAVLKCCRYIGAFPFAGRFTPGTFTNQIQRAFREPRLLICHDTVADRQAVSEASFVNIPVIAFCDANSSPRLVDIVIPCNTREKHSIGLMFWLLSREVLRLQGKISREMPWDVMVDLFFYRSPEDQKQEEISQPQGMLTTSGVLASMQGGAQQQSAAGLTGFGGVPVATGAQDRIEPDEEWNAQGWEADPVGQVGQQQLAPGAARGFATATGPGAQAVPQQAAPSAGPQVTMQPGTDWSAVGTDDWTNADSWN